MLPAGLLNPKIHTGFSKASRLQISLSMDLHMIQWRNQHESEQQKSQQHYVKIPKLLTDPYRQASSAVPLFAPEPKAKISNLSGIFADSPIRFPSVARVGCYFSLAQWQELELQTLIYNYIVAGAAVPPELLHRIWISLLHSRSNFLHHYSNTYQPALLQSGYWRRAMDPEPGRCRRTDGKKWRCARDVMAGQKYCERHVRRGRNHSRKSVEMSSPNDTITTTFDGALGSGALEATTTTVSPPAAVANGPKFNLSGPSPSINILRTNQSSSDSKTEHKGLFEAQNDLRHFFDDWPLSLQQSNNAGRSNANSIKSNLCLSISMPGNSSSNVSLKLSTGTMDEQGPRDGRSEQLQLNWTASMGGPLAEALRSTSDSFPTSILH